MNTNFVYTFLYWVYLNIMVVITFDMALFMQTTFKKEEATFYNKLLTSEFWATIEWFFVIPTNRVGYTFLNPAQIGLSSYVFDFLAQIISNTYWLNVPTTIDDYTGMIIILLGMGFSTFRTFG